MTSSCACALCSVEVRKPCSCNCRLLCSGHVTGVCSGSVLPASSLRGVAPCSIRSFCATSACPGEEMGLRRMCGGLPCRTPACLLRRRTSRMYLGANFLVYSPSSKTVISAVCLSQCGNLYGTSQGCRLRRTRSFCVPRRCSKSATLRSTKTGSAPGSHGLPTE